MDFAQARLNMLDGQLRPNKVTDAALLAAMGEVPREAFLPPERVALAYADEDVPVGPGRWLMEPMVFARLVQAAEVGEGTRVLVVAAGAGYGALVLARSGASVVALEAPGVMAGSLAPRLPGVTVVSGPVTEGWAAAAPYDVILIEGAVEHVPAAIEAQLAEGGRLVTVMAAARRFVLGLAVRRVRLGGTVTEVPLFDAGTPALPEFRRAPAFVF
ncbi:protein-L-isoaspartate O-methyltransferase [Elioraea sp.]|uniref:protein-L-isoaspartate O-methyltransferase family protein n=1 Tax=Elioraea sp. TaxID=2185103 RepID=UPI0025BA777C|nr:protein-L-isoaspartate O-methyltransferase [Elioraea sp.]